MLQNLFFIPLPSVVDTEQLIITVYKKLGRFPDSSKAKENNLNGCITSHSPYIQDVYAMIMITKT